MYKTYLWHHVDKARFQFDRIAWEKFHGPEYRALVYWRFLRYPYYKCCLWFITEIIVASIKFIASVTCMFSTNIWTEIVIKLAY